MKEKKHKIINTDKVLEILLKIQDIFKEEELSMLDIEYVVRELQRTMDA